MPSLSGIDVSVPFRRCSFPLRGQLKTIRGFGVASVRGFPVRLPKHTVHSLAETELSLRGEEFALGVKAGAAVYFLNIFFLLREKHDVASFLPETVA